MRAALADSWKRAVLAAYGNQLFDYAALVLSLYAVGARPDPVPVLLAFVLASVLAMIPLTPGGLGFVEAGLTGVLTLAGVPADQAVLGVLHVPAVLVLAAAARRRDRVGTVRTPPACEPRNLVTQLVRANAGPRTIVAAAFSKRQRPRSRGRSSVG